jgi:hypothetical protein
MKYIMIEGCFPVLFHESINHIDVAQALCGDPTLVTSAAYCKWDKATGRMVPYGESTGLKLTPAAHDEYLLTLYVTGNN